MRGVPVRLAVAVFALAAVLVPFMALATLGRGGDPTFWVRATFCVNAVGLLVWFGGSRVARNTQATRTN